MRTEARPTRGHNEGSIFRRKTGEWIAAVTLRNGKRATRWSKSREEAKADLAELLRLRDAGARDTGRVRLGDYLERWVSRDHNWAPATRRKHEAIVRLHLVPTLGHIRMSEMSVVDVDRVLGQLPVGPRSAAHVRATLRRALADALRDGLVTRNPGALSRPIKQPHRERTILDADQARLLIDSTRGTPNGPLWTILVTTGMRISEALGLTWSDVDFGGSDARVARQAGPTERVRERSDRLRPTAGAHSAASVRAPAVSERGGGGGVNDVLVRRGERPSGPSITVRHALQRVNGEWQLRPPKTAKGRRTIPLTPLGVEALRERRRQQLEDRFGDSRRSVDVGGSGATGRVDVADGARGEWRLVGDGLVAARPGDARLPDRQFVAQRGAVRERGRGAAGADIATHRGNILPLDDTLVFTTSTGNAIHATNLLPKLRADLAAAGLPKVGLHDLRHSAATILFAQGLPVEAIADLLGHSTVRVTQDLYRHRVEAFSVLAAEKMQEALG